ncbi:MAG: hypothetical protein ACOCTT_00595 [archaeon]
MDKIFEEIKTDEFLNKRKTLEKIKEAFEEDEPRKLREISNQATEKAMIIKEEELIEISLISYGLSKIIRKPHYRKEPEWSEFKEEIIGELERNMEKKGRIVEEVTKTIMKFNEEAGNYIEGVIDHGRKKQASRLYALGLSLKKSVELTGTTQEELLPYIGATKITEKRHTQTISTEERYQNARKIMEGKK